MDSPRELAQLPGRLGQVVDRLVQQRACLPGRLQLPAREAQEDPEVGQASLRAVVQIVLQPAAGLVGRVHDPRSGSSQLHLGPLALGDVPQVAGEHRRPGQVDAGDRELDRELASVRAHAHQFEPLVDHVLLAGLEQPGEAVAMADSERRGNDQLGHLAADRLVGPVAERAFSRRIELDHAA